MNQQKLNKAEIQYLKDGKRVKAVISYCQRTGVSVSESKAVVNEWLEETATVREEFDAAFDGILR